VTRWLRGLPADLDRDGASVIEERAGSHAASLAARLRWTAVLLHHARRQARLPFDAGRIERDQAARVRRMIRHAYATVPHYREAMDRAGLRVADFRTAADLARLPMVEPEDLQRDVMRFTSGAAPVSTYLRLRSGGSTGRPRTVFHDTRALFENAAHGERERSLVARLVGKRVGYRESLIVVPHSSAEIVQAHCAERSLVPPGVRIARQYLSLFDAPEDNVRRLNAFAPDVIHAFGSYLEALFGYLHATGAPFHRPKVVTYSSDGLPEAARRLITETFGIPVLGTYQAVEAFKIAFECGAGLHVNADLYPVRIVDRDGRAVPVGESGEVVVSNLVNRATVLLNYRLGDLAALAPDPCPCGRALPRLAGLHGRRDEWIDLPSGRTVHPMTVRRIFTHGSRSGSTR
jgi:phenylacetate-CoA ligase